MRANLPMVKFGLLVAEPGIPNAAAVELTPKPVQDRFASSVVR
jgi:hypothetical protein